jgi:phage tail sheath gpL-like
MVSFNQLPGTLRVPFVAAEFDGARASGGPALLAFRALLIGQKNSVGTAAGNAILKVANADQVATLAGRGSQLHRMAKAWFTENTNTECWIGVLADDGAATAATATVTVTGAATAAGTLALYVAGNLVRVAVTSGMTATQVAAAIAAAIGNTVGGNDLPVTCTSALGVATITGVNKGIAANEYDLRVNYQSDSESTPAGITVAVTAFSGGATNPVLTSLIAAMGDTWFNVIAHPYTDATSLAAIEAELASRMGPLRMIDGVAITAKSGTYSTVSTLGAGRNSPSSVIVRTNDSPTPPMEYAASVAGVVALSAQADPARPFQTLPLAWVLPPALSALDTLQMRNLLLYSGISVTRLAGTQVVIDRLITTYQTNAAGSSDQAYLSVETLFTLAYLRYSFRVQMQTRYPRHKLANDGTRLGAGQAVITPLLGKAEAVSWFRSMEELGLVEGFDQFKADLVVERDATDANRLNLLLPPNLINQLIVTAAKVQFRL